MNIFKSKKIQVCLTIFTIQIFLFIFIGATARKIISTTYGDSRTAKKNSLNRKIRRICRKECEILENDFCRREYAIAKRHPVIRQLPLLECSDLPEEHTPEASDCLSLGIAPIEVQESECQRNIQIKI